MVRRMAAALGAMLLLAISAGGCSILAGTEALEGDWSLMSVNGRPAAVPGSMTFTAVQMRVATGCNTGGGAYSVAGNRLVVEEFGMSAMGCEDPAGAQEEAFVAVLRDSPTWIVVGDVLTISGSNGDSLTFGRALPA